MQGNSCAPDAVTNGRCIKYRNGVNDSNCDAAMSAVDGTTAVSVSADEATAASGANPAAGADTESTQAAKEKTPADQATATGEPAQSAAAETAKKKPTNSVLRSSIARYGSNSYYYAHAGLPAAAEDMSKYAKMTQSPGIVTGGPPILLGRSTAGEKGDDAALTNDALLLSPSDAAAAAVAGKRLTGFTVLQTYMWTDDGPRVSVYVPLAKLPETFAEKELDPCFDATLAAAAFEDECAALVVYRKAKKYLLSLRKLYFPIKPLESRATVKNDKIVLRLVKEDENLTWFSLMKNK